MPLGPVLDPTAARDDDNPSPDPDAGVLAGKRVGIRLDQIWRDRRGAEAPRSGFAELARKLDAGETPFVR